MTPEELLSAHIDSAIESAANARDAYNLSPTIQVTALDEAIIRSLGEIALALSAIRHQFEAHRTVLADVESHEARLCRLEERGR